MFTASVWRLGEEKVCARIEEYMDSEEEWISDYMEDIYDARLRPQPQVEGVMNETVQGGTRLTNKQLIILFEHVLNVTPRPEYINVKAFSNLIAQVSGRSADSIRQIVMKGIDYELPSVHNDIDRIEALVRPISETFADKIKNSKEKKY
jgi:hypothetical protein